MTSYPVFDCHHADWTRDVEPIGQANSEAEALELLRRHYAGTEAQEPTRVVLTESRLEAVRGSAAGIYGWFDVTPA